MPYGNDFMKGRWEPEITARILEPPDRPLDEVVHFCSVLEGRRVRNAARSVAWLFYELTTLPPKIVGEINTNELVLATSRFVAEVFRDAGVTVPVRVMGHGYDPSVYTYWPRRLEGRFEFLCVAEHTTRKNLPMLIACFERAFGGRKDVRLTLKLATHGEKELRNLIGDPERIRLVTDHLDEEWQLAELYHGAHCFVLPTRGEGFGMPMLEAMATGLPVMVTDVGGHMDFASASTAYLIRNRGFVESDPECFPHLSSRWADPDPDHLIALMREVVEDYESARARAAEAWKVIKDDWTWDAQLAKEYPGDS